MRKTLILLSFLISFSVYAGDVANFVNLGFSPDGTKFAFGQHGVKDGTYEAYAEIYLVDIVSNTFLSDGVFKTSPTKNTYGADSKSVFLALLNRAQPYLTRRNISQSLPGRPLYSQTDENKNDKTLLFRDFETNEEYTVVMHTEKKTSMEASFYITADIIKPDGAKIRKQIGRPEYTRKGVKAYAIKKIFIDNTNSSLVFIIEKKEYDKTGDSIRYMAEVMPL